MAGKQTSRSQFFTSVLIVVFGIVMVGGSFLLRFNYGEEASKDQQVIKYSYHNISKDPQKNSHFRQINITLESLNELIPKNTKNMRVSISRTAETGSVALDYGVVFSIVVERMVKFRSVLFDYEHCVFEKEAYTDIVLYLIIKNDIGTAVKKVIVNIDRRSDKISVIGKELSAADIGSMDTLNKLWGDEHGHRNRTDSK